jgi:hypothetical protein
MADYNMVGIQSKIKSLQAEKRHLGKSHSRQREVIDREIQNLKGNAIKSKTLKSKW